MKKTFLNPRTEVWAVPAPRDAGQTYQTVSNFMFSPPSWLTKILKSFLQATGSFNCEITF
jgi:hypothetical protein